MTRAIELVISGLSLGGIYALVAFWWAATVAVPPSFGGGRVPAFLGVAQPRPAHRAPAPLALQGGMLVVGWMHSSGRLPCLSHFRALVSAAFCPRLAHTHTAL